MFSVTSSYFVCKPMLVTTQVLAVAGITLCDQRLFRASWHNPLESAPVSSPQRSRIEMASLMHVRYPELRAALQLSAPLVKPISRPYELFRRANPRAGSANRKLGLGFSQPFLGYKKTPYLFCTTRCHRRLPKTCLGIVRSSSGRLAYAELLRATDGS
jgi:hypothetical protein